MTSTCELFFPSPPALLDDDAGVLGLDFPPDSALATDSGFELGLKLRPGGGDLGRDGVRHIRNDGRNGTCCLLLLTRAGGGRLRLDEGAGLCTTTDSTREQR